MIDCVAGVVDVRLAAATASEHEVLGRRLANAVGGGKVVGAGAAMFAVHAGSVFADGDLVCVLGGTLFNRGALRERLALPADAGAAHVMAAAWRAWGPDGFRQARGDFAVAVFDAAGRTGALACDHMGGRTLLLRDDSGRLAFGSEPPVLATLLDHGLAPDPGALANWLAVDASPPAQSLFEGVVRLPGGSWMPLPPPGGLTAQRYWEPGGGASIHGSATELAAGLRERLEVAIGRRVGTEDGPVGIMLSGGLDSSTVAGLAARALEPGRLRGYSAVFPGKPTVDESELIGELRRANGMAGVEVSVRSGSVIGGALDHVERWHVPPVSPNLFFWEPLLARAHEDGVRVLLDGEGGDELFGVAPYLLADYVRRGRVRAAGELVRNAAMGSDVSRRAVRRILLRYGLLGALPYPLHMALRRARGTDVLTPEWLAPALAGVHRDGIDLWAWKRSAGPRWRAHIVSDVILVGSAAAYEHVRRRAAGAGLLARHPLIDADVIDYMLRIPPESAFHPDLTRPLLRRSVRDVVPDAVRLRPDKSNFDAVFHAALEGPDRAPARALILASDAELRPYVDRAKVAEILDAPADRFPGGILPWAIYTWRLVTAELWLRQLAGRPVRALPGLTKSDLDLFHT